MQLNWSRPTEPLLGLSYSAESGHIFTRGIKPILTLWLAGEIVQQRQAVDSLPVGASSGDGKFHAVATQQGRLWLLGDDLRTRWECQLPSAIVGLALDSTGDLLAVADAESKLSLFHTATGKPLWRIDATRPLRHLCFIPELPILLAAADTGVLLAIDPSGAIRWQVGVAAHIGSLSTSGDGKSIVLAGQGEGVCLFDATGERRRGPTRRGACARVSVAYHGHVLVMERSTGAIELAIVSGASLGKHMPTGRLLELWLRPVADAMVYGLKDGGIVEVGLRK